MIPNSHRAAWLATFLSAVTLVAMVALAWVNRATADMRWLPYALIPFACGLPVVFFQIARHQSHLEEKIRDLQSRLETMSGQSDER